MIVCVVVYLKILISWRKEKIQDHRIYSYDNSVAPVVLW